MEKIRAMTEVISGLDEEIMRKVEKRLDCLTKPQGSLGRMETLIRQLAGITRKERPFFGSKIIFTLAADHGVARQGVSAYPQEVTAQMVYNFINGGAAINVLARHAGARVVVVDMGVAQKIASNSPQFRNKKIGYGTKNMLEQPAMTPQEVYQAIEAGVEVFLAEASQGMDIVAVGEMGIGNTTSASAITACITNRDVRQITGRGTGIDAQALENKINVIKLVLTKLKPAPSDAIDVLSKVGGFEIAGMVGIILAAAGHRVPVVIDGFICGAAALIAYTLTPKVRDFIIASHCSAESGHKIILEYMGLNPLLDLEMRLGEGTGAALAMHIIDASAKILNEMATFDDAGVSERKL